MTCRNMETHPYRIIIQKKQEGFDQIWYTYATEPEAISALQAIAAVPDVASAYIYDTKRSKRIDLRPSQMPPNAM